MFSQVSMHVDLYNSDSNTVASVIIMSASIENLCIQIAIETAFNVCTISLYSVTVGVHKCRSPLPHHHPGQSVHRQNTPSKKSQ